MIAALDALDLGNIKGQKIELTAGTTLHTESVDAQSDLYAVALGSIFGSFQSGCDVTVLSYDSISITKLHATNSATIIAAGALDIRDARTVNGSLGITGMGAVTGKYASGKDLTVVSKGAVFFESASATQDIFVTAGFSITGPMNATNGGVSVLANNGDIDGIISAAQNVSIVATQGSVTKNVTSQRGRIDLLASGSVNGDPPTPPHSGPKSTTPSYVTQRNFRSDDL